MSGEKVTATRFEHQNRTPSAAPRLRIAEDAGSQGHRGFRNQSQKYCVPWPDDRINSNPHFPASVRASAGEIVAPTQVPASSEMPESPDLEFENCAGL